MASTTSNPSIQPSEVYYAVVGQLLALIASTDSHFQEFQKEFVEKGKTLDQTGIGRRTIQQLQEHLRTMEAKLSSAPDDALRQQVEADIARTQEFIKSMQFKASDLSPGGSSEASGEENTGNMPIHTLRQVQPGDNQLPLPFRIGLGGIPIGGDKYIPLPVFPRTTGCNVM